MKVEIIKHPRWRLLRWEFFSLPLFLTSILGLSGLTACRSDSIAPSSDTTTTNLAQSAATQTITLKTTDGWMIMGDRYQPITAAKGAVVLLHQRGGSAQDWQPLSTALVQAGFIALAIDQRGAGRSTQGPGPIGQNAPWPTSGDIDSAIASLPKGLPVGLVGASYGANNALIYGAAHPQSLKALVLFSPGANYNGLDALAAARKNLTPLMVFHGENDSISGNGPQQINSLSPTRQKRLQLLQSSNHGTELLTAETIQETVNFLTRAFIP